MFLGENSGLHKGWQFLQKYILTLRRFDLFLQGSLLIVILLETNILLLLRRHYGGGYTPAAVEDWVMMGASTAEVLLGSVVGWYGRRYRNLALSATLALAAIPGFFVLLVPFGDTSFPYVELCDEESVSQPSSPDQPVRAVLLVTCAVCCTLAKVSIWAHGVTYLDDHEPHNGPYFYGILISIRLSLGLSGQNWLQDSSLSEEWWKAHLSISSLTFMFAILFTLFPKQMREFPEPMPLISAGYLSSLKRLAQNKVLVLQTVAMAMLSIAVFGYVHYDRAYVQARFHVEAYRQDPQTSRSISDVFRALVIIFFVMIFRVRFSSRRSDGVKASTAARVGGVVAIVVAILLAVLAALSCDLTEVRGVSEGGYEQPACSLQCGCDSTKYGFSPVCDLESQITYFSPCNAGCSQVENLNGFLLFGDCACGMRRAPRGACSLPRCRLAYAAYQLLYTVMLAVAGASFLMQGMVVLRAVQRDDKAVAVGTSFAAVALVAFVIGHGLYMVISYATCAFNHVAACMLHHQSIWILCACSAALALGSAAVSLIASTVVSAVPSTEM